MKRLTGNMWPMVLVGTQRDVDVHTGLELVDVADAEKEGEEGR
jgi:hypothetical protein